MNTLVPSERKVHNTVLSDMSTTPRDPPDDAEFTTIGPDAHDYERYAQAAIDEGSVLLYDRTNEDAWIISDAPVVLAEIA